MFSMLKESRCGWRMINHVTNRRIFAAIVTQPLHYVRPEWVWQLPNSSIRAIVLFIIRFYCVYYSLLCLIIVCSAQHSQFNYCHHNPLLTWLIQCVSCPVPGFQFVICFYDRPLLFLTSSCSNEKFLVLSANASFSKFFQC